MSENVSSVVPAAPSDPDSAMWSCDGRHAVTALTVDEVLVDEVLVEGAVDALVVVVDTSVVDGVELDELCAHAPRAAARKSVPSPAAVRVVIVMSQPCDPSGP